MNILITGGCGFLGKNLIATLSKNQGNKIIATYNNAIPENFNRVEWLKQNLLNIDSGSIFKNIDVVFMLAAVSSGAKDIIERPEIFVTDNTLINQNTIVSAVKNGVKHVIFPSCSIMYSSSLELQDEESPTDQIYEKYFGGATMKLYIENLCKFYSLISETKFTVIRQTNIYGPNDKFIKERAHVLAATILKTENNPSEIEVWGSGEEGRDFLHVDDLMQLYEKILEKKTNKFDLVCAGSEKLTTINELVDEIINIKNISPIVTRNISKPSLPINIVLSNKLAKKLFDWSPKITLSEGLKNTIEWRNNEVMKASNSN
jgi:GDP-L-fucose synthase